MHRYLGCRYAAEVRHQIVPWLLSYCLVLTAGDLLRAAGSASLGPMRSTTSRVAREEAIDAIPLKKINAKYRRSVSKVIHDSSLYRRLPTQVIDCDPQLFTFLAKNPDTLVAMWQQLGISHVKLVRTGAGTFRLADGAGTTGELVIVEQKCDDRAQNRIVMYAQGAYDGKPFKRPVRAECVLLLRSGSLKESDGRDYVAARLDSFVRLERTSIELFAKALHPWVGKTADANFVDTLTFISNFSRAAETRPATIERLVTALPQVSERRRDQLVQLAYRKANAQASASVRVARRPE